MKSLRFEKLELLSTIEKRAKTVEFHPRLTVIKGENDVGKSSVIKSLYWAFGASAKTHPSWKKANVKALVTFTVDGKRHFILRDGSRIALFDGDSKVMLSTTSITSELGPAFAELVNFRLILTDKNGSSGTPPPAFALLPFYIDQDRGWGQTLESFDNIQQYPGVRKSVVEFHSGIRSNEFYELTAEKRSAVLERDEVGRDRKAVENAITKLGLEPDFTGLELNASEHETSIEQLLVRLKTLRDARQRRAAELAVLVDERSTVREQMEIAIAAAKEFDEDFRWLSKVDDNEILCPTCGTVHQNNFANKFAIVDDSEACSDFVSDCLERMNVIASKAKVIEDSMRETDRTTEEISRILADRQGDLTLGDVIKAESRRNARAVLGAQVSELAEQMARIAGEIAATEDKLKEFEKASRKRKKEVEAFYAAEMLKFLKSLAVQNIDHDSVTKIVRKIDDTGSDLPRAVLSYHLALMRTIFKFSTALTAPMVIDSPNQQDQDAGNVAAMIALIVESRPQDGQTVLGTVSLHDQKIVDGKVITFRDKGAVLAAEEYESVTARFRPFLDQMI